MENKKIKWLIYTVLVGLIPIMSRLLVWLVANKTNIEMLSASDFVAFGLVLHISNINEIEHLEQNDKSWKTIHNGISITFIALYSVLLATFLLGSTQPNLIDVKAIKAASIILSIVSLFISYSVYYRISMSTGGN
jgi:hypothetical protein